jgi:hypothetical protein
MPNIDLQQFRTIDDLKQLMKTIETEIAQRRAEAREKFYEQAKQVAAELDMKVSELFGKPRKSKGRDKSRGKKAAQASEARQQPNKTRPEQAHEQERRTVS